VNLGGELQIPRLFFDRNVLKLNQLKLFNLLLLKTYSIFIKSQKQNNVFYIHLYTSKVFLKIKKIFNIHLKFIHFNKISHIYRLVSAWANNDEQTTVFVDIDICI